MESNEWLMLTDNQIEYGSLSEEILRMLALEDDLFIAQSALTELSIRQSGLAAPVALEILSNNLGDRYLQAGALKVLFDNDQKQSIEFIEQNISDFEPYLLNIVLEIILENQPEFSSKAVEPLLTAVKTRLDELPVNTEYIAPETGTDFLQFYDKKQLVGGEGAKKR